jgi:hypothetical protein
MGYIRHHAMVVTDGGYGEDINEAHKFATLCELNPTPIMHSPSNGYRSFFIPSDGSKEGWEQSHAGDENRARFKKFMRKRLPYIDWAEIAYGGDDGYCSVEDDCSKKDNES